MEAISGLIYQQQDLLAQGGFGKVYSTPEGIIKVSSDQERELQTLRIMSGERGFPKLIDWGNNFTVQQRLGVTMMQIYKQHNKNLRKVDIIKVGIQLLKIVEKLHERGILHLDIKLDNIMTDRAPPTSIYPINEQ